MIHVKQLRKTYGAITAVDDVSLEIHAGEAFGLLGPNGAGKTTTISMMIGLLQPDSGEVLVDGQSPLKPHTRHLIGLAPQSLSLYEELTGQENLHFFGQLYNLSGDRLAEREQWALEFAELTDRARDRVDTYSGGMKRRLNLACALIHEPKVILLDEPTVGVDPHSRNHLFHCIEQLKQSGTTIIYTTHYMEEAQRLCDRVAIMDHGKILAMDSVDNLIQAHGGPSLILAEVRNPQVLDESLMGSVDNNTWRVQSDEPLQQIALATEHGCKFDSLQITSPDLESVFLTLTGRSLRD